MTVPPTPSASKRPVPGPGVHPLVSGGYDYIVVGNVVSAFSSAVGDPFAGGSRTWSDPAVNWALRAARDNPTLTDDTRALLPWALTTITARSPSALGLFARAGYAGPGATGLLDNLAHRQRGDALAAELIVGATLLTWPIDVTVGTSDEAVPLGGPGQRADFGIKLLGGPRRRTVEADVLLTDEHGNRRALDVKHSITGIYRHAPTSSALDVVTDAIARAEIASFHLVATGRFQRHIHTVLASREGVHIHEHVWPTPDQRADITRREALAIDYTRLIHESATNTDLVLALTSASRDVSRHLASPATAGLAFAHSDHRASLELATPTGVAVVADIAAMARNGSDQLIAVPLPEMTNPLVQRLKAHSSGRIRNAIEPQSELLNHLLARPFPLNELLHQGQPALVFTRTLQRSPTGLPGEVESVVLAPPGPLLFRSFLI